MGVVGGNVFGVIWYARKEVGLLYLCLKNKFHPQARDTSRESCRTLQEVSRWSQVHDHHELSCCCPVSHSMGTGNAVNHSFPMPVPVDVRRFSQAWIPEKGSGWWLSLDWLRKWDSFEVQDGFHIFSKEEKKSIFFSLWLWSPTHFLV